MKTKIISLAMVISLIACSKKDDPDPYPVPSGCIAIGVRCNDLRHFPDKDPKICDTHMGFKEWICQ
jgi:hypothetical protein